MNRVSNAHVRKALAAVLAVCVAAGPLSAGIGARLPGITLSDASGTKHSLAGYGGRVLVLAFWSFKCPVSLAYDERLNAVKQKYGDRVLVLGVAANANESPQEIQRNAANLNVGFPILIDAEAQLADSLGATHTPTVFVVDAEGVVRYQGAVDNNRRPGEGGRAAHLEDALDAVLAGRPVAVPETRPTGCTIKRR